MESVSQHEREESTPPNQTEQDKKLTKKGVTGILDSAAIEKALLNLQRAENDAAVVQMRSQKTNNIIFQLAFNALGQLFYRIGLQTEYSFITAKRFLSRVSISIFSLLGAILGSIVAPIVHFFQLMFRDLYAPYEHLYSNWLELREVGEKGELLHFLLRTARHILLSILSWLLPIGASFLFLFTLHQTLSNGFSLQVTYHDEVMGYVATDTVWDSAVKIVSSRIIATKDSELENSWLDTPEFSLVPVSASEQVSDVMMADTIITQSSDKIQNAVGITVNGQLIGVTNNGDSLQKELDQIIEQAKGETQHLSIDFAQNIQLVPGVYFTSSIQSTQEVMQALHAVPEYLQIQTIDQEEYEEEIPVTVVEQENSKYYEGVRRTIQKGKPGKQKVVAEVVRINGAEIARTPISTTPITEMTPQIVMVGTRKKSPSIGQVGNGAWTFPVPNYTSMGTYPGHRGYDFGAPYGAPIYAAEGGTILKAEYHYSWGNYVLIDHHNGLYSLYAHASSLAVSAGQQVQRGQVIAYIGATGNASGYHLHMEVWTDPSGARWALQNPLNYVSPPK